MITEGRVPHDSLAERGGGCLPRPAWRARYVQPRSNSHCPAGRPWYAPPLQHLQFSLVLRGSDVLDIPWPALRQVHYPHRRRTQPRLTRAHGRGFKATLASGFRQ